jgi:hypothetical protein
LTGVHGGAIVGAIHLNATPPPFISVGSPYTSAFVESRSDRARTRAQYEVPAVSGVMSTATWRASVYGLSEVIARGVQAVVAVVTLHFWVGGALQLQPPE